MIRIYLSRYIRVVGIAAVVAGIALAAYIRVAHGQPVIPPPIIPSSPRWSAWFVGAQPFRQDHYIHTLATASNPAAIRANQSALFSASAILHNDSTTPLALYNSSFPKTEGWTFSFCDTGTDPLTCTPSAVTVATGTIPSVPPYDSWNVYCVSANAAECPTGVEGLYGTSGVKHTFPREGMYGYGVRVQDTHGHACQQSFTTKVKQRNLLWYEVLPRF